MPMASPIIKTRVWSTRAPGDVRKKNANVMWKSERDVMIVFPERRPILVSEDIQKREKRRDWTS
jgi:hypothetical protein